MLNWELVGVKVHQLKSLGAKLFYQMTILVILTIMGNSWQFFRTFRTYQLQQMQDSLQGQAERAKDQAENILENWRSQVAIALPTLRGSDTKDPKNALQRFIDANHEFAFIQLLSAPSASSIATRPLGDAATSHIADKNFEDKDAAKVISAGKEASLTWLKTQIPVLKRTNFAVESLAEKVDLPLLAMAIRFEVAGSEGVVWAILGIWQTSLMRTLLKSSTINSAVVDAKGHIFSSLDPTETLGKKSFGGRPLLKKAINGSSPSGFESEYRDSRGHLRVGAFARLQRYPLTILIEQDADAATQTVKKSLVSTSLWAAMFVLFAIMFSFVGSSSITKGLRAVAYATSRISGGDLTYKIPRGPEDEVGALGQAVNHMSGKMIELMRSQVDKARFEKELDTAKMVQSTFFPKQSIHRPHFDVSGFYTPASECGGDLWGHFTIADGVEFLFIADAMGHGAPAALVTAMAYSTTMTVADIIHTDPSYRDSPGALLQRINRIIFEAVRGTICMTFFASILDLNKGTLTYANAGHNFPVILPLDPKDPRLGKTSKSMQKIGAIQPISLKLMGTPLGIAADTEFKEQVFDIKAGDKIFYFTDGLIECVSPTGEQWGRKHLLAEVGLGASMNPQQLCDDIVKKAFDFFGGVPLADDITVVVAEIGKEWSKHIGTVDQQDLIKVEEQLPALNLAALNSGPTVPSPTSLPEISELRAITSTLQDMVANQAHESNPIVQDGADQMPAFAEPAPKIHTVSVTQAKPQSLGKYKLKLPNAV